MSELWSLLLALAAIAAPLGLAWMLLGRDERLSKQRPKARPRHRPGTPAHGDGRDGRDNGGPP